MKRIIWVIGAFSCWLASIYVIDNTIFKYDLDVLFINHVLGKAEMYNHYYKVYNEFPVSNEEMCNYFREDFESNPDSIVVLNDYKNLSRKYADSIDWRWSYFYYNSIDPLSKEKNIWIYFPIYDRWTKRRENFIILSTGIDGKQDNFLNINDTLYLDNFDKKLRLYNNPAFYVYHQRDSMHGVINRINDKFPNNIFVRLFGNKDYLISVNGYSENKGIKEYTQKYLLKTSN